MGEPLTAVEQVVLESLDLDGMVEGVRELVAIPSWGGRETPAQEWVAERIEAFGLALDLWEIDLEELAGHPAYSAELERDRALGVVGSLEGGEEGGSTLVLNGHVDVVPPGEEGLWSRPPFEGAVEDGAVHGRGSLDMKGGLVAGLFALKAVRDAGVRLDGSVHLQSVIGEEDGGSGTLAAVLRGYTGAGAVVMEPTKLSVAPAQAGAFNFRVRVPGRAAHGAVRNEGVSALEKAIVLHREILALEEERNRRLRSDPLFEGYSLPFPICIGTIRGGDWASSVPDHVTFEGRFGVSPAEEIEEARKSLERRIAEAADGDSFLRENPPSLEWWGGQFAPARTDPEHALVRTLTASFRDVTGREPRVEGMPYGADMGILVLEGGTPTVLFGPGDVRRAHRPDESVAITELEATARSLALLILRFCGIRGTERGPTAP